MKKSEFIKPELTVEELSLALYQVNQRLEQTNNELMRSKKEQEEIFANISHDLRSPITAIRNSVEYMLSLQNLDSEEMGGLLKVMYQRVEYLEHMINDVFLLTTVDSSKNALQFEKVNIGMMLEDFFFSCDADQKYEKRNLRLDVPEDFPYEVNMDCKMILRVLDNLFSNALKYSEENADIILSAKITGSEHILIEVTDTGIGIDHKHLAKIFDRTYMVESARTPGKFAGCGLGLSIAKSIVESHGGTITCESVRGKGSTFSIMLPVEKE